MATVRRLAIVVLVIGYTAAVAHADPSADERAAEHFRAAIQAYKARNFARAATEFERAYDINRAAPALFAWAQAERLAGRCPVATNLYGRFLATQPVEIDAKAARVGLAACKGRLAKTGGDDSGAGDGVRRVATAPAEISPRVATERRGRNNRAWYRDRIGGVLMGAGVVAIGLGAGFFAAGRDRLDELRTTPNYDQFDEVLDSANGRRRTGAVALVVGGVLLASGLVRYYLVRRVARATLSMSVSGPGSARVVVGLRF